MPTAIARLLSPAIILRLEGATAGVGSVLLYRHTGENWLIFVLLILAPDLAALGYLLGTRAGASCYNLAHNYTLPVGLLAASLLAGRPIFAALATIWCAHIGIDRLLGYGLKYTTAFKDTHLGRV